MVFSTNQARHLYVVSDVKESFSSPIVAGEIIPGAADGDLFFEYMGADKVARRSDLIPIESITYAKATSSEDLAVKAKAYKVTVSSAAQDANNSSKLFGGDYTLKLNVRQYNSLTDEGAETRVADVRVPKAGMTASLFYIKMACALAANLSHEIAPIVNVYLATSGGATAAEVTPEDAKALIAANDDTQYTTKYSSTYTGITVVEAEQPWVLGTLPFETVDFSVVPGILEFEDGDTIQWGTAAAVESGVTYGDGKKIADLEYFCLGERGDVYRGIGWPNTIKTDYQVNPESEYSVIDIHYAYQGTCEDIQKSEKDITLVCLDAKLSALISAINDATGAQPGEVAYIESPNGSSSN